jgi:hypothetical protein
MKQATERNINGNESHALVGVNSKRQSCTAPKCRTGEMRSQIPFSSKLSHAGFADHLLSLSISQRHDAVNKIQGEFGNNFVQRMADQIMPQSSLACSGGKNGLIQRYSFRPKISHSKILDDQELNGVLGDQNLNAFFLNELNLDINAPPNNHPNTPADVGEIKEENDDEIGGTNDYKLILGNLENKEFED